MEQFFDTSKKMSSKFKMCIKYLGLTTLLEHQISLYLDTYQIVCPQEHNSYFIRVSFEGQNYEFVLKIKNTYLPLFELLFSKSPWYRYQHLMIRFSIPLTFAALFTIVFELEAHPEQE